MTNNASGPKELVAALRPELTLLGHPSAGARVREVVLYKILPDGISSPLWAESMVLLRRAYE